MTVTDHHVHATSILVVEPVTPFRRSIATHLTALVEEFESIEHTQVMVISFKSLYPAWLFPGESDLSGERHKPNATNVDYILNSINPFTWFKAAQHIRRFKPDVVILPLWSFFPAVCLGWVANRCRKWGFNVTTIVHNTADHEQNRVKNFLHRYQARASDNYLLHSHAAAKSFSSLFPARQSSIHPLPIGRGYPIQLNDQSIGIDQGDLERPCVKLLFFGLIRAYKGLEIALQALALIQNQSVTLTVAGEVWSDLEDIEALIARLGVKHRVTLIPRYVDEKQAHDLFRHCDLVLLPYKKISSSGVLPLAYAFGKPVVASNLPGLIEQIDHGSTGWVVSEYSPVSFAEAIQEALKFAKSPRIKSAVKQKALTLSWRTYASSILAMNRNPAQFDDDDNQRRA